MAGPSIPGYERLTQIGKGGFSRVYRGEQTKLKRGVAIKVLNFGLNDEADRRSFERECQLMGRVSTHPNIVTVHDTAFTADGQPCIVMEHYPGGSLADLISEVRQLNAKEVLEVGVAIAAALEASHSAGVLHCDLKPQNILISEFGQPALGDFGISTFSEERTRTGGDSGAGFTLAYAAPEIVEGASPSAESDVYSLAATLYTSLAGRRPFYYLGADGAKPTAAEQARRILLEEPASLTESGVPAALDVVIRRAMAKDPSKRPASAAEFARDLYRVGHELGLGTASPRFADQGALPVLDPRADFTDPSLPPTAVAAPPVPTPEPVAPADVTELRDPVADETALRLDPIAEPVAPRAPVRRSLAPYLGIAALLVVGLILFSLTRGDGSESSTTATPVPSTRTPQAEVLLAPPPPRGVTAQRAGADGVLVSWTNEPEDDITYEVRRDDGPAGPSAENSPVLFQGINSDDITCFEVVAVRGSRLSPAPDRACTAALGATYVDASPMSCDAPCDVGLALTGFDPDQLITVSAMNAIGSVAAEVEYDVELRTDASGLAPDWTVSFDEDDAPAMYLIELTPEGSSDTYLAAIIVSPPGTG